MSVVNISVDTNTRQAVLTVDNQIIPAIACHLSKGIDFEGDSFLRLSYIVQVENTGGLTERREFFLPDVDDEAVFASNKDGLASRVLEDDEDISMVKGVSDTIKYMQNRKT